MRLRGVQHGTDKVPIDLQLVERQRLQMQEAGVVRSEVIQRQPAAHSFERVGDVDAAWFVDGDGCFGDLKGETTKRVADGGGHGLDLFRQEGSRSCSADALMDMEHGHSSLRSSGAACALRSSMSSPSQPSRSTWGYSCRATRSLLCCGDIWPASQSRQADLFAVRQGVGSTGQIVGYIKAPCLRIRGMRANPGLQFELV